MVTGMGIGIQQTWVNFSVEISKSPFLIYKNEDILMVSTSQSWRGESQGAFELALDIFIIEPYRPIDHKHIQQLDMKIISDCIHRLSK